jgi:hypothetical protein
MYKKNEARNSKPDLGWKSGSFEIDLGVPTITDRDREEHIRFHETHLKVLLRVSIAFFVRTASRKQRQSRLRSGSQTPGSLNT